MASMAESPASSCVSSDEEEATAAKAMVVAGCPRCLMYVMLSSEEPPRCPRCKSPVLLHFLHGDGADANTAPDAKANPNANANANRQGGKS